MSKIKISVRDIEFEIGNFAYCVGTDEDITEDETYEVLDVCSEDYSIKIKDDSGNTQWYGAEVFICVELD
jgi:hypothetical protein